VDVVELLLARGADPTLKNVRGQTPLDVADENNQKDAGELLRHAHK
jgi:ankyrin repeat protein